MASEIMSGAMSSDVMEPTESQSTDLKLIPMPYVNGPTKNGIISQPSLQWSRWQELPDSTSIYAPAAVSPSANRIDVFRIATDSKMYHNWWDGSKWNVWTPLGDKVFTSAPTAISPSPNRIDVFGISTDKKIYRQSWNGSKWNEQWESLGGVCIHGLAATSWGPNRIDLFAVGTNSCLYHKWWDGSGWNGWEPLKLKDQMDWEKSSTTIYAPTAVASENRIDLFAVGIDNNIYHAWWDGEEWIGWEKVDGPCIQGIAVTSRERNQLDLFTIGTDIEGTDNHLYHSVCNRSNWGNWENLGGACISAPAVVARDTNKLDTFVIGTRNAIYQKSWGQTGEGAGAQGESSPNYTHVQYIGYPIPTGIYKEFSGTLSNVVITQKYLGYWDSNADWISRCTLMEEAIKLAASRSEVSQDESCLKIFMAPEFYFRGSVGAYDLDIYQRIIGQLRTMVNDPKWKHWLFIFGTIVAGAELSDEEKLKELVEDKTGKSIKELTSEEKKAALEQLTAKEKEEKLKETIKEIYNTAFVQKGGMGEEGSRAIIKEFISRIDFAKIVTEKEGGKTWDWRLEDESLLSNEEVREIFKAPSGEGKENQWKNYDGRGIFEIDGINFGLEICLDHSDTIHRLRNSPPAVGQKRVQIHLIPSAGMSINPESVVAVTDGHVFNCDGANEGKTKALNVFNNTTVYGQSHTQIATVGVMYDRGTAPDTFKKPTNISDYTPTIIQVPPSNKVYTPLYFEDPGELHIYKPLVIPPMSVVA